MDDIRVRPGSRASQFTTSVETSTSWLIAIAALAVTAVSFGAPYVAIVALKPIAADLGTDRSIPALAGALSWLGSAVGGIGMGWLADRIGARWTVLFGALMIATGLVVASSGGTVPFLIGHGIFIGLLGNAGINAPLYVYVSRWFDRRRGTALALISSGMYVAGAVWPNVFAWSIGSIGWRHTMMLFAIVVVAVIVPAGLLLRQPPAASSTAAGAWEPRRGERVLGLPPNLALGLISLASLLCCVPMAMPQGHLVAFCSDLGIPSGQGAAMLSLLLGCAFISRQIWGWVADRIGGLRTVLAASFCQAVALTGFLLTQDELGLFAVSAAFGLGFSGLVPAYVLAVRELFPVSEAGWRVPTMLLCSGSGMALGGWLAGVIYDHYGFYAPAFATGIAFNLANLVVVGSLVLRQYPWRPQARLAH